MDKKKRKTGKKLRGKNLQGGHLEFFVDVIQAMTMTHHYTLLKT